MGSEPGPIWPRVQVSNVYLGDVLLILSTVLYIRDNHFDTEPDYRVMDADGIIGSFAICTSDEIII